MRSLRYLAEGEPAVAYAPEEEDENYEDAPRYQDEFEQQVQEANRPVPGMVGVTRDMIPQQDYVPDNVIWKGHRTAPMDEDPTRYLNTDDPGAPGQAPWDAPSPKEHADQPSYTRDLEALKAQYAKMPVKTPPKWWERAIAGGVGGIAGWSNAASRTRNPIDIAAVSDNILHPGYNAKLAEWQSRVLPLEKAAEISGQQAAAGWKGQQIQSETALKSAQAEAARQHGAYWLSRSQQERNQWKIDPKTGSLYNTITGQISRKAPTEKDRYDTAIALGASPEQAREYGLTGKLLNTPAGRVPTANTSLLAIRATGATTGNPEIDKMDPKAAKQAIEIGKDRDPLVDIARQDMIDQRKRQEADRTSNWKVSEEQRIAAWRQSQINSLESNTRNPQDAAGERARINEEARAALQNIQNEYARRGRAIGGSMQDFDVKVGPHEEFVYSQRQAQAPAPRPAQAATSGHPAQGGAAPQVKVGDPVTVDGKPATVTGINPQTGKPIIRFH